LREEAFVNGHMHLFNPRGGPVHSTDVSLIQSWMTYDYVGHVYGLPINYLKTTLSITDPNYPHVTISNSAGALHENADALTAQVRSAVTHYFVAPTP
jgi:hypothetical protein